MNFDMQQVTATLRGGKIIQIGFASVSHHIGVCLADFVGFRARFVRSFVSRHCSVWNIETLSRNSDYENCARDALCRPLNSSKWLWYEFYQFNTAQPFSRNNNRYGGLLSDPFQFEHRSHSHFIVALFIVHTNQLFDPTELIKWLWYDSNKKHFTVSLWDQADLADERIGRILWKLNWHILVAK